MTRVGVISDTHGLVRPEISALFNGVDLILHAGDVGGGDVLGELRKIAPVEAVYGNVDDRRDPRLRAAVRLTLEGVSIHVSHGHEFGQPTPELALSRYDAQVVVFGHTHRAVVVRAPRGRLGINPGAAGPRRFKLAPSVAILTLDTGAADVQVLSIP